MTLFIIHATIDVAAVLYFSQWEERAKTAYIFSFSVKELQKWAFDFVVSQSAMSPSLKCDRMLISKRDMLHCLRGLQRPLSPNESFIWLDESWVLWENTLNVLTPSSSLIEYELDINDDACWWFQWALWNVGIGSEWLITFLGGIICIFALLICVRWNVKLKGFGW